MGAPSATVFFSRIPGEEVDPPPALEPDYYSLNILDSGAVATFRWEWVPALEDWVQRSPLVADDVESARDSVPPQRKRVPISGRCPCREAFELYEVRW